MKKVFYAEHNGIKIAAYFHEKQKVNPYKVYRIEDNRRKLIEKYEDFQSVLYFAGQYLYS